MKKLADILIKYRLAFFAGSMLLFIGGAVLIPVPTFTGSLAGFQLENNAHFVNFRKTDSLFGGQLKVFLNVVSEDDDLEKTFDGVRQLTKELSKNFTEVTFVSPLTFYSKMKIHFDPENNSLNNFFTQAKEVPILEQLIANDKKSFLIVVSTDDKNTFDIDLFNQIIGKPKTGLSSIKPFSTAHIESSIADYLKIDIGRLILLLSVFFFAYIILVFRNFKAVVFTFLIVVLSIGVTLWLFSILAISINLISILAIPIVLILALSDALHLLSGYIKQNQLPKKEDRIKNVVAQYFIPSLFSSATTAAALYSFYLFNESPYIQEFGLVTSIALMLEVILTFSIAPFLLYSFNLTKVNDAKIIGLSKFLIRVRKPVSLALLTILVVSIFVVARLEFKSSNEMFFPIGSEMKEIHEDFKVNFASGLTLDVFIKQEGSSIANVSQSHSKLYEYTKLLSEELKTQDPVAYVNSATNNFTFISNLGQAVDLYDVLGSRNPYYNKEQNTYHIELMFASGDAIVAFQKSTLEKILASAPIDVSVTYSSMAILTNEVNKSVAASLIKSLSTSGIVIFLMILLLTRSFKRSLFSLAPNIVPLAFVVLIFVIFNVHLNIITAVSGVICLGLLDDDTVHILYRKLWLKEEMEELSFSILSSAILLIVGFAFFTTSSFGPIRVLGWVSALIFFIGIISEMTLMQWVLDSAKNDKKK